MLLLPKDENFGVKGYVLVALLFAAGFVAWRFRVADLADEVVDHGDWLLVRRGAVEEKVLLTDIAQVNDSGRGDSPRIVLRLVKPGRLGRQIAFIPQQSAGWSINPFAKTEIGEDLITRVEQARKA